MSTDNRNTILLKKINIAGKGLEIGPLSWPILTKNEANIKYVDHATTDELIKLYKNDSGIKPEEIVAVDYALQGRSLAETVRGKKFDYIVASHVIEHVPDMVNWLKDMSNTLHLGGVLSLAIPDKRYTFDIDREVSTAADVIGAYLEKRVRPDSSTVLDYFINYRAKVDPHQAWEGQLYTSEEAGPHRYSINDAIRYAEVNLRSEEYVDTHCFVYTPASFFKVINTLCQLGLCDFKVDSFTDTQKNQYEFFVTLKKVDKPEEHISTIPKLKNEYTYRELERKNFNLNTRNTELQNELDRLLTRRLRKRAVRIKLAIKDILNAYIR